MSTGSLAEAGHTMQMQFGYLASRNTTIWLEKVAL